ncbi:MAG: putative Ig domain-containing protein [Vicinamibacteria bacterium]
MLSITVNAASNPLSITTTSLNPPTATVGVGYTAQQAMVATGGQTPYSWSASGLPNGMGINSSSGALFGTPTAASTFAFTVTVRDSSSPQKMASKVLSIIVNTVGASLSITTTSLAPATATVGVAYGAQQAIAATGGQTPYSWSVSGLPNGMGINSSSGAVFGTPTVPGTFNFTVTVRDGSSPQKATSKVLVLSVAGPASTPVIHSIAPGMPQVALSPQSVTVSGSNFQAPFTVTVFFPGGGSTNLSGAQILNVTSSSFVMNTAFSTAGAWGVRVSNPDGSQSNLFNFTVQSTIQSPAVGSINPTAPVARASDQELSVYGSNFQQNLTVSLTAPGGGAITLSGAQITAVTSASFRMRLSLLAAGGWSIRVNNPDGRLSNAFSFGVIASTGAPSISSINPVTLTASSVSQSVTVIGNYFQPGLTVDLVSPSGEETTLQAPSQIQNVASTSFVLRIALSSLGTWSIRATNTDGGQSTVFPFTVSAPSTGTCSRQITRFSQSALEWNQPGQTYDGTVKTIADKGCALTALAMAINAAGWQTNPGDLNDFMKAHRGYIPGSMGDVDWTTATTSVSTTIDATTGKRNSSLKYLPLPSSSLGDLEFRLCQGYPVIVGVDLRLNVPGHFVLVTGKEGGDFTIADPGHANRTKLFGDYNNLFVARGSVVPSNATVANALVNSYLLNADSVASLSTVNISVGDNAELMIIDAAGRRTGHDPTTGVLLEEIPYSVYFSDSLNNDQTGELDSQSTHSLILSQAVQGRYTLIVTGQVSGPSEVSVTSFAEDGSAQLDVSILSLAQAGSTATYQIDVGTTVLTSVPIVVTGSASSITDESAALNGTVNAQGLATTLVFNYGLTNAYGTTTGITNVGSGTTAGAFSVPASGLTCATTYHFRASATNGAGTTNGADNTFVTAACPLPPTVTTLAATAVAQTGATLKGQVNPNGGTTNRRFQYGLTNAYGTTTADLAIGKGNSPVDVTFTATSLTCATMYHYRAVGQNGGGTTNGSDQSFTTSACAVGTDNTVAARARAIAMNSEAGDSLSTSRSEVWYKVPLYASRSYQFSAFVVEDDGTAGVTAVDLALFSDAAGVTLATPSPTTTSGVLEGSSNLSPTFSQSTLFQPTASGQYLLRVLGQPAAGATAIRIVARETTLFSPWIFVTTASQYESYHTVHNNTSQAVAVTLRAVDATGTTLGNVTTFSIPANATVFRTTKGDLGVAPDAFGGTMLTHNGAFGAISANTTTLSGATGLSFDSPFAPRAGNVLGSPIR